MSYEEVLKIAARRGIFFKSSELYPNSPAGFWEYGPYGVRIKENFVNFLRKKLKEVDAIEIDGACIMPKEVFEASSHLKNFVDPIVECKQCKQVYRIDKLIEEKTGKPVPERLKKEEFEKLIEKEKIRCPKCKGQFSEVKFFNLMFRVDVGVKGQECYLRPETCQAIFLDFKRVFKVMRRKLPCVVLQVGKSFRNEISPRQSLLRMREFYQAEVEVFFNPKTKKFPPIEKFKSFKLRFWEDGKVREISVEKALKNKEVSNELIAFFLAFIQNFYEELGFPRGKLRLRKLKENEKAFYAKEAWDLEVLTSLGWVELVACNNRGDYDLKVHSKHSGEDLEVMDGEEKVLPHVFELSIGIDRSILSLLDLSFKVDKSRKLLSLKPIMAPVKLCVFPLVAKDGLPEKAKEVCSLLEDFDYVYEEKDSIGRRYYRYDEIGVPFAITIDHQSLEDDTVTLRDRDSTEQIRVKIKELPQILKKLLSCEVSFEELKGKLEK